MTEVPEGIILLGTPAAQELGFTQDHFSEDSYLWRIGDSIMISNIECKTPGNGHFRRLLETIESKKFTIKVPTPMRRMQEILDKNGFYHSIDPEQGFQVWIKHPSRSDAKSDSL